MRRSTRGSRGVPRPLGTQEAHTYTTTGKASGLARTCTGSARPPAAHTRSHAPRSCAPLGSHTPRHALLLALPHRPPLPPRPPPGLGRFTASDGSRFEGRYQAGERVWGTAVSADGGSTYTGGWGGREEAGEGAAGAAAPVIAQRGRPSPRLQARSRVVETLTLYSSLMSVGPQVQGHAAAWGGAAGAAPPARACRGRVHWPCAAG